MRLSRIQPIQRGSPHRFQIESLEKRLPLHSDLPDGFSLSFVASGFSQPTAMEIAPDGRFFVAQATGELMVVDNSVVTPFATLPVNSTGERGLLGVTVDPDFEKNNYVYVYYTAASPTAHNRISRLTADGNMMVSGSEFVLMDIEDSQSTSHNAGTLDFGIDGKLYVSVGDDNQPLNPQSLTTRRGKVLRINPDGSIPTDNPFYDDLVGENRAIWAYGLRNPFKLAIERGTGRTYINDVGSSKFEEINEGQPGANFGWPDTEGYTTDPNFDSPVYAYPHGSGVGEGCAIVGATFYNPEVPTFPAEYVGGYFFSDWCSLPIERYDAATDQTYPFIHQAPENIVDMKVSPVGDLYLLTRGGPPWNPIYKISYQASETPPTISQHPLDQTGNMSQPVTFAVKAAGDATVKYQWHRDGVDIPGETASSYTIPSVSLNDDGVFFSVTVTNRVGSIVSNNALLTVTDDIAPTAIIDLPLDGDNYQAGNIITFSGFGTDVEDGNISPADHTWVVDFHHDDHTHPFVSETPGIDSGDMIHSELQVTIPTLGETTDNVWYRFYLTVIDSNGRSDTTFHEIFPEKSTISFDTIPAGLDVTLDGQPRDTPSSVLGVVGIERTLGLVEPQLLGDVNYVFREWSTGSVNTHVISTPENDTNYTARFDGWVGTDVGAVPIPGTEAFPGDGSYVVDGSGNSILGTTDDFRFLYHANGLDGDGEIIAKVDSVPGPGAKAGVMVRESLATDSPFAAMALTSDSVMSFLSRESAGQSSSQTFGSPATEPIWMKIERSGDVYSGHQSSDGKSWQPVGSVSLSSENAEIGLFVTNNGASKITQTVFTDVRVIDSTPPSAHLTDPTDTSLIESAELNARGYIDVTFIDTGGSGIDAASINGNEIGLGGAGLGSAVLGGTAIHQVGSTYRYMFTGNFVDGPVDVQIQTDSFRDLDGNLNTGQFQRFDVETSTTGTIIDNSDPGFSRTGSWGTLRRGFGVDSDFSNAGIGKDVATWTFSGLTPGDYQVALTWPPKPNRATDSPFSVFDGGTRFGPFPIDQKVAPDDFEDEGSSWETLGTFSISGTSLVVELTDLASRYVAADAVRIIPTETGDKDRPVADLTDPANGESIESLAFNARGYLEVTFSDSGGSGIDPSSIDGDEISLTNTGSAQLNGTVVHQTGFTYHYGFKGAFADGPVQVDIPAGTFLDLVGNANVAETENFDVQTTDTIPPTADLKDPTNGGVIESLDLNARGYLEVTFSDSGGIDPSSIDGNEISLEGTGSAQLDGTAVLQSGSTYHYGFTGTFADGQVHVDFQAGTFLDLAGNANVDETEDFDVQTTDTIPPTANLTDPANGGVIESSTLNARGYLEITFSDGGGSGIDPASIDGDEISLAGTGSAQLDGTAVLQSGSTYRYGVTGPFADGHVYVDFLAGTFLDLTGNTNVGETEDFGVKTFEQVTIIDNGDDGYVVVGRWGYKSFGFAGDSQSSAPGAGDRDIATWTFSGLDPGNVHVSVTWPPKPNKATNAPFTVIDGNTSYGPFPINQKTRPSHLSDAGVFWEELGTFDLNGSSLVVQLTDYADGFVGADAVRIAVSTSNEDAYPPSANLADPIQGSIVQSSDINSRKYIDVTFSDSEGSGMNTATIDGDEIAIDGAGITLNGTAVLQNGTTYRYAFTGYLIDGPIDVDIVANSFQDLAGNRNIAGTRSFTVQTEDVAPTADLADPLDGGTIESSDINTRKYIDITFNDTGGSGLDTATIDGDEITVANAAVTLNGTAELQTGTTYRYAFTGDFVDGAVEIDMVADSFHDNAGNGNVSETDSFAVETTTSNVVIIDNGDDGHVSVGRWRNQRYGFAGDSQSSARGTGNRDIATWTFSGLDPGNVHVSVTWPPKPNRATNAPFMVIDGNTSYGPFPINQKTRPSRLGDAGVFWEELGTFDLTGNTLVVQLVDKADGYVGADAVRILTSASNGDTDPPHATLADPLEGSITESSDINSRKYIDVTFSDIGGSGLDTATIDGDEIAITDGGITLNGTAKLQNGSTYRYAFSGYLIDGAVDVDVIADSFQDNNGNGNTAETKNFTVETTASDVVIVDNRTPGYSISGRWGTLSQGYANYSNFSSAGTGKDKASWTFSDLTPGGYQVSVTWPPRPNRATNSPFTVFDGGTSFGPFFVAQNANPTSFTDDDGILWEDLGTFNIGGTSLVVQLTDFANGYVGADAVRIELDDTGDVSGAPLIATSVGQRQNRHVNPWHNTQQPLDTSGNGQVSSIDFLLIVNEINSVGSRNPTNFPPKSSVASHLDINNDIFVSPLKSLLIANHLNSQVSLRSLKLSRQTTKHTLSIASIDHVLASDAKNNTSSFDPIKVTYEELFEP